MKLLNAFLLFSALAIAQQDRPVRFFPTDPTGPCSVITPLVNNWVAGRVWQCVGAAGVNNGTWQLLAPQQALTLTTTGSSGAATLNNGTLNIPQYTGGGGLGSASCAALSVSGNAVTLSFSSTVNCDLFTITAATTVTLPVPSGSGQYSFQVTNTGPVAGSNLIYAGATERGLPTTVDASSNNAVTTVLMHYAGSAWIFDGAQSATATALGVGQIPANGVAGVPVAATAHNVAAPLLCSPASGSATAYTCTTTPTFSPARGDEIRFCPDLANTGAAPTLNVNSSGAATILKQQGAAALVANDIQATPACVNMQYDGTRWLLGSPGTAAGGSSGITMGGFGSRPSCSSSASMYFSTDVPIISQCNGTSWTDFVEGAYAVLPSMFTWTAQGTSTITTNGIVTINGTSTATASFVGEDVALAALQSPPYTIIARVKPGSPISSGVSANFPFAALYLRGTGGILAIGIGNSGIVGVTFMASLTGSPASNSAGTGVFGLKTDYLKIQYDGTNVAFFACAELSGCTQAMITETLAGQGISAPLFGGVGMQLDIASAGKPMMMVALDFRVLAGLQ